MLTAVSVDHLSFPRKEKESCAPKAVKFRVLGLFHYSEAWVSSPLGPALFSSPLSSVERLLFSFSPSIQIINPRALKRGWSFQTLCFMCLRRLKSSICSLFSLLLSFPLLPLSSFLTRWIFKSHSPLLTSNSNSTAYKTVDTCVSALRSFSAKYEESSSSPPEIAEN